MESKENEIVLKAIANETIGDTKSQNPGLRALLAIKKHTAILVSDINELLQFENKLDELYKKGLQLLEANSSPQSIAIWKEEFLKVTNALKGIKDSLSTAKEMTDQNIKEGYTEICKQLSVHKSELKDGSENAINKGFDLLPEAFHLKWETEFVKLEKPLMHSLLKRVESCRVMLQIIEQYTPDELNAITQIIVDHIPLDFTYDEALEYQKDYYKALANFKKEFKEEKNLWDKFLDILAGGTHQSPSERVMMERWLDGEKDDL